MTVEFHPEASAEYDEAALYYESKESGLDLRFIVCVEEAINGILGNPLRWRLFAGDVRRALIRVFPYGVFYNVNKDVVLIIAVAHCSQKPGYWTHRTGS